jgi:membrane-associated phospholipid phosphatase
VKQFASSLPRNIIDCFKGRLVFWHLLAAGLTLAMVWSGFDWFYFRSTRDLVAHRWWHAALSVGMLLPVLLPVSLIISGFILVRPKISLGGWAVGQAALIGWFISSIYKFFTGRVHPEHVIGNDISHVFRFGFYRGGVFWGWPSSHTTVAFAMAVALFTLFPKHAWLKWSAVAYAFYIGISVSMTIHWFSDFAAGAILGSVVGVVVGKSFRSEQAELSRP